VLNALYQWARDRLAPTPEDDRPPRRLGCIDVEVYAEPQSDGDIEFLQQVQRLKTIHAQGRTAPIALQRYFAERYLERSIRQRAGCSFETYLKRPLLVEHIRDDLASSHP
jgi:hypothetical protein